VALGRRVASWGDVVALGEMWWLLGGCGGSRETLAHWLDVVAHEETWRISRFCGLLRRCGVSRGDKVDFR
jgi:hypothetical protein